jgi:hypothetical protein
VDPSTSTKQAKVEELVPLVLPAQNYPSLAFAHHLPLFLQTNGPESSPDRAIPSRLASPAIGCSRLVVDNMRRGEYSGAPDPLS